MDKQQLKSVAVEIADETAPRLIDEMNHATGSTERLAAMVGIGKQYVYDAERPTRIMVDGVDTDIAMLTDSERVTAGEQLLKRLSDQHGVPVSDLRKHMATVAEEARGVAGRAQKPAPIIQAVKTVHGTQQQFLATQGLNRKQRRAEQSGTNRAVKKHRR